MKPQSADPRDGFHDPAWQLLIEVSLPYSKDLSANTSCKPLVEVANDLGLRQAQFERLQADILRCVHNHAAKRSGQIEPGLSIIIRLYVKKRGTQAAHNEKNHPGGGSSLDQRANGPKPGEWVQPEGGWGYFISERSLNKTGLEARSYLIEIYLYREGK